MLDHRVGFPGKLKDKAGVAGIFTRFALRVKMAVWLQMRVSHTRAWCWLHMLLDFSSKPLRVA